MINKIKEQTNDEVSEYFSPGRINLIGEHIDYVGGLVIPSSISLGIKAYAAKSKNIKIFSENFSSLGWVSQEINFSKKYDKKDGFMNFVNGIYNVLSDKIKPDQGLILILNSTIPVASGLSSSAAFTMLIFEILNDFYDLGLSKMEQVKLGKRVENEYMGVNSGIMDQFAIEFGKKDHFIKLNTYTLEYEYVRATMNDYKFVLFSSGKSRELASSGYNTRVGELQEVSRILDVEFDKLASVTDMSALNKIQDGVLKKRMKHVITECARVELISNDLSNMDGATLGKIINEAHDSLSKDYEVSCNELDFIHDNLAKNSKVFGSRMIGAGFGGCLLAIVHKDFKLKSIDFDKTYHKKFGIEFQTYEFSIEDGTTRVHAKTN